MEYQSYFNEIVEKEYGKDVLKEINDNIIKFRKPSFRINPLKGDVTCVQAKLESLGFKLSSIDFYDNAFILENKTQEELENTDVYKDGQIYLQSLSSMIPPLILNPKVNTDILDMAAAPGGKTTQIAALTSNKARITACEMNTIRAKRLEYNVKMQGATSVFVLNQDSRNLDELFSFDAILLDAPCSGSGTRTTKESFKGLTEILVKKSVASQTKLLAKALKLLKKNGTLIYSTCSIFKEENEEVLKSVLKDKSFQIESIDFNSNLIKKLPSSINGVLTIAPTEHTEGFFIAKIRKV